MLTIYRRHYGDCPHSSMGQRKCRCPIWAHGKVRGKYIRRSLKTVNWETAGQMVRELEQEARPISVSVVEACDRFMEYQAGRNLRASSLAKYTLLTKELKAELAGAIEGVSRADLEQYQASWKLGPQSRSNKLSRLRTFFRWCVECGWIQSNPAKGLARPIFERKQAIPFTQDEVEKLLWSTELYNDSPPGRRKQVRAFVLVMRYTGLRIGDVVALRRESITDGKLHLRTAEDGNGCLAALETRSGARTGGNRGCAWVLFLVGRGDA